MIAKKVEEFILETILEQNWPLLLSFICFNLAYVIAEFPLCSFLLCIAGFAFLISVYFGTLSIVSTGRAVLITGCDSGFGNELAKKLNAMGFTVFAGCLDEKSNGAIELNRIGDETGQRLHVVQMNVTKQEEVGKALDYVEKHLPENGLLWGVVNNAGQYGSPGCFEWIPTHVLEKEMSVNLFGAIRVTNAFMPLIRRSQGRIVNVSSIMDRMTSPFSGCYTITKGAIESYSAILRLEMKRFNVQVVVIEPGNFMAATNINKSNAGEDTCQSRRLWDQLDDQIKNDYGEDCFHQVISINRKLADISTGEPHTVVDAMVNAVSRLYPKNRYFVANMSDKIMAYGMQFLPLWISDRLLLAIINNPVLFDSMQHFKYVVLIPFLAALLWLGAKICNM